MQLLVLPSGSSLVAGITIDSLAVLVVLALATWRVAHMLVQEYGPWGIFQKLRTSAGIVHDADGRMVAWGTGNVLACVWCLSVWAGILLLMLPLIVSVVFALSAAACIIESTSVVGGGNGES